MGDIKDLPVESTEFCVEPKLPEASQNSAETKTVDKAAKTTLLTLFKQMDDANNKKQTSISQPSPASVKNEPATTNIGLGLNYQENQNAILSLRNKNLLQNSENSREQNFYNFCEENYDVEEEYKNYNNTIIAPDADKPQKPKSDGRRGNGPELAVYSSPNMKICDLVGKPQFPVMSTPKCVMFGGKDAGQYPNTTAFSTQDKKLVRGVERGSGRGTLGLYESGYSNQMLGNLTEPGEGKITGRDGENRETTEFANFAQEEHSNSQEEEKSESIAQENIVREDDASSNSNSDRMDVENQSQDPNENDEYQSSRSKEEIDPKTISHRTRSQKRTP
jgi:hypothetical protein